MPLDLIVLTASNGENRKLAERFVQAAANQNANAEQIDLPQFDQPLFTPRVPAAVAGPDLTTLRDPLHQTPRWVICATEYNGSIPPSLTTAIAWLSGPDDAFRSLFNGRPIAMATFSGGGGMELLVSLRIQLTHLGAQVVGRQLLSNHAKPAQDDSITDLVQRLLQMQPLQL